MRAMKENMPHINIEAKPIHRLPHLSRNSASKIAAGSSVIAAMENDVNTSGSNNFMFQTCPSNTQTINNLKAKFSINNCFKREQSKVELIISVTHLPINNEYDSNTS